MNPTICPSRLRRVALSVLALSAFLAAARPAAAETLCSLRAATGAIVYTNMPTNEGRCASRASVPMGAMGGGLSRESSDTDARFDSLIRNWASRYNVSPNLVHAVVSTESAYNPGAISPKGARGLMQLMPQTARRYGVTNSLDADGVSSRVER